MKILLNVYNISKNCGCTWTKTYVIVAIVFRTFYLSHIYHTNIICFLTFQWLAILFFCSLFLLLVLAFYQFSRVVSMWIWDNFNHLFFALFLSSSLPNVEWFVFREDRTLRSLFRVHLYIVSSWAFQVTCSFLELGILIWHPCL